jgi:hypothetical protein
VQSVSINTNVVSSNHDHGEVCSIQHYVIKFVSDLPQVFDFLGVLRWTITNIVDSGAKHYNSNLEMIVQVFFHTLEKYQMPHIYNLGGKCCCKIISHKHYLKVNEIRLLIKKYNI